jgi:hypothetical protein
LAFSCCNDYSLTNKTYELTGHVLDTLFKGQIIKGGIRIELPEIVIPYDLFRHFPDVISNDIIRSLSYQSLINIVDRDIDLCWDERHFLFEQIVLGIEQKEMYERSVDYLSFEITNPHDPHDLHVDVYKKWTSKIPPEHYDEIIEDLREKLRRDYHELFNLRAMFEVGIRFKDRTRCTHVPPNYNVCPIKIMRDCDVAITRDIYELIMSLPEEIISDSDRYAAIAEYIFEQPKSFTFSVYGHMIFISKSINFLVKNHFVYKMFRNKLSVNVPANESTIDDFQFYYEHILHSFYAWAVVYESNDWRSRYRDVNFTQLDRWELSINPEGTRQRIRMEAKNNTIHAIQRAGSQETLFQELINTDCVKETREVTILKIIADHHYNNVLRFQHYPLFLSEKDNQSLFTMATLRTVGNPIMVNIPNEILQLIFSYRLIV